MADANTDLPTVVYIAGYGRSGSTVLDLILGAGDRAVAVGELFMFFRPGETLGCSCGQPVRECPFWSKVRASYAEQTKSSGDDSLGLAFRRKVEGLLAPLAGLFAGELRQEYVRHERALLSAIAQASGRSVVVDSSKTSVEVAWRPAALARRCGARVKMIHLVRDGRAVMWSVMRGCNRKLERGEPDPRLSFPRLRSVLGWTLGNLAALVQSWRLGSRNTLRVAYEDLARDPAGELARIGEFLALDLSPVVAQIEAHAPLPPGHSISGNRLRHSGLAEIREDDEWRERLPLSARLVYWWFGWPAHLMFVRPRTRRNLKPHPQGLRRSESPAPMTPTSPGA